MRVPRGRSFDLHRPISLQGGPIKSKQLQNNHLNPIENPSLCMLHFKSNRMP